MAGRLKCCCGECSSLWRVFVPCDETFQNRSIRIPAVLTADLEDSDLEEGQVYLYDPTLECETYCGRWSCIDDVAATDLCRDSPADPDNCPPCSTTWGDPYRLVNSIEVAAGFFDDFEEMDNGCCDLDCPSVCDDYGTPLGSDCATCYDPATQLGFQLSYSFTNTPASRLITGLNCGTGNNLTTSAAISTLGGWSGVHPTTDDHYIVALLRFNLTTSPWYCTNLITTAGACGGWCADVDSDPTDAPTNTQYRDMYLIVKTVCGGPPQAGVKLDVQTVLPSAVTAAIPALSGVTQTLWASGDCGENLNLVVPNFTNGNFSPVPVVSSSIGWGGNALCLDETMAWEFPVMSECVDTTLPETGGECELRVRVALSLPNRPGTCP